MDAKDPNPRPRPLTMAHGNSPWGEGSGARDEDKTKPADAAAPVDEPQPNNPWLDQEDDPRPRPRRSASIEDILRQRPGGAGRIKASWISILLASLVAAWIAATSVHVLDRGERALVLTMGRYSHAIGPGLNLTLPWPLQSVIRRNLGADSLTVVPEKDGEALMPTRDGELIDVSFRIRWRIADLQAFAFNFPEGEAAIRRLADAQVRAAVAELPFKATYDGDLRGQLQLRAAQRMQRVLDAWGAGVQVVSIELVRVAPPARLVETFQKIEKARDEARRNRENDEAWRQQELGSARREAAEFESVYAQYQVAPAITRSRIYYETMERILRANPVILGGSAPMNAPPPTQNAEGK